MDAITCAVCWTFFMQYIKILFSSLHPEFLIRNYVIGLFFSAFYGYVLYMMYQQNTDIFIMALFALYVVVSFILFPFSVLVWDECMRVMRGDSVFIITGMMLIVKLIIKVILFGFAIYVAPFGILYLAYRIKREMNQQQNQWQQNQWHQ